MRWAKWEFLVLFPCLVLGLAAFLYSSQPPSRRRASRAQEGRQEIRARGSQDSTFTIRIADFEVGPDDEEPRIAGEFLIEGPGEFDVTQERVTRVPVARAPLHLGVGDPRLMAPPAARAKEVTERFYNRGSTRESTDGTFELRFEVSGRGYSSSERTLRLNVTKSIAGTSFNNNDDDWRFRFTLAWVDRKGSGRWTIDDWRKAIVSSCRGTDEYGIAWDALRAATWIPCPDGKHDFLKFENAALTSGENSAEKLRLARLMAGDAEVVSATWNIDSEWGWRVRTIYLKYPELRPFARRMMNENKRGLLRVGPVLSARLRSDPELHVHGRLTSPTNQGLWTAVGGLLVITLLMMAAWVFPGGPVSAARGAALLGWGASLSVVRISPDWLELTDFLALPLLAAGSVAFSRTSSGKSSWIKVAAAVGLVLVVLQVCVLAGAPAALRQVGDVAFALLPAILLAATSPLVPDGVSGLTPRRALTAYSLTILLPSLSWKLAELANWARPRFDESARFIPSEGWPGWFFLAAVFMGAASVMFAFATLWRRLGTAAPSA